MKTIVFTICSIISTSFLVSAQQSDTTSRTSQYKREDYKYAVVYHSGNRNESTENSDFVDCYSIYTIVYENKNTETTEFKLPFKSKQLDTTYIFFMLHIISVMEENGYIFVSNWSKDFSMFEFNGYGHAYQQEYYLFRKKIY